MQNLNSQHAAQTIIEALIFASQTPLSLHKIHRLIQPTHGLTKDELVGIIRRIQQDYQARGVQLVTLKEGYQFQTAKELAPILKQLHQPTRSKFSQAFLETLAVIAYRQPVTRADIEQARGVSVNVQFFQTMQERKWIKIVGYKHVPGRPALYATTPQFLNYFGLSHLDELPSLDDPESIHKTNLADC